MMPQLSHCCVLSRCLYNFAALAQYLNAILPKSQQGIESLQKDVSVVIASWEVPFLQSTYVLLYGSSHVCIPKAAPSVLGRLLAQCVCTPLASTFCVAWHSPVQLSSEHLKLCSMPCQM